METVSILLGLPLRRDSGLRREEGGGKIKQHGNQPRKRAESHEAKIRERAISHAGSLHFVGSARMHQEAPPQSHKLEGQIFIVTKAGGAVKMAGSHVMLVESNAALTHLQEAYRAVTNGLESSMEELTNVLAQYEITVREHSNLSKQMMMLTAEKSNRDTVIAENRRLSQNLVNLQNQAAAAGPLSPVRDSDLRSDARLSARDSAERDAIRRQIQQDMAKIAVQNTELKSRMQTWETSNMECRRKLEEAGAKLVQLKARMEALAEDASEMTLFNILSGKPWPEMLQSTMADADGKFSLQIPSGRDVLVVAFSSRQLFDEAEEYLWVLPPKTQTNSPMLLNNANIYQFGAPLNQ